MAVVVGIFPGSDPRDLQQALTSGALDMSNIRVITNEESSQAHEDAPFDFVHVAEAQLSNSLSDDMTGGTGIMSDAGGTRVPGISGGGMLSSFYHSSAGNYLSGIGLPDDEVDNFNDAIADGKSVVVYTTTDPTSATAELRAAGLLNVRAY